MQNSIFKPPHNVTHSFSPIVHLSLTIVYTVLYGLLFFIIYAQLWMILYFKHKRFSYQSVFLFLCLIWAALRTTLFSFYFKNSDLANSLGTFLYWLLYCCPVCLQFSTLCLLVLFFAQVVFKAQGNYEFRKYRISLWLAVGGGVLFFLITNVSCAVVIYQDEYDSENPPVAVSMIRVVINDSLFIIYGVALSYYIYKMSKMSSAVMVLEAKGTTVRQALICCVLIVLLFTTRVVYNIIAIARPLNELISFGYGWINVSDQADFGQLNKGFAYASFGIVLFVWELLPTFILVMFFRVQRPKNQMEDFPALAENGISPKDYLFANPRRYDSDDDLSRISQATRAQSGFLDAAAPYSVNTGNVNYLGGAQETPPISFQTPRSASDLRLVEEGYDGI